MSRSKSKSTSKSKSKTSDVVEDYYAIVPVHVTVYFKASNQDSAWNEAQRISDNLEVSVSQSASKEDKLLEFDFDTDSASIEVNLHE